MPLIAAILIIGVFPQPLLDMIKQPVAAFVTRTAAPAAKVVRQRKSIEDLRREGVRAFPGMPQQVPGLVTPTGNAGGAVIPGLPSMPGMPPLPGVSPRPMGTPGGPGQDH